MKTSYIISLLTGLLILGIQSGVRAYDDLPNELTVGSLRTQAEKVAVLAVVKYASDFSIEKTKIIENKQKGIRLRGYYDSPSLKIQTGSQDSFDGVILKLDRNYIYADLDEQNGIRTESPFTVIPFSVGVEADKNFSKVNTLLEAGWMPFNLKSQVGFKQGKIFGVFLQAGFKSQSGSSLPATTGGNIDQSKENVGESILRVKAMASGHFNIQKRIQFIGDLTGWYDIRNATQYYKADGTFRLRLDQSRFFDMKYESGSGAPNFNKGSQFSAGLTVQY